MSKLSFAVGLAFASVLSLAGCAADSADSAPPADGATDDQDLTKAGPLSKDLVCAARKAFDDNSEGEGLAAVPRSDLKGDALADFKTFQKGMASDYPSRAFKLPVPFKGKTYSFIVVLEENDGGMYAGIYRLDGRSVATLSQGESGEPNWSKPADSCN